MKPLFIAIALLFVVSAHASPYLVSGPAPHAIGLQYEVWSAGKLIYSGDNEPDGSIRIDLATLPMGDYEMQALYRAGANISDLSVPAYIHATPYYVTWTSCKPTTVKIRRK